MRSLRLRRILSKEAVGMSELEKYLELEKTAKSQGEEAVQQLDQNIDQEYEMKTEEASAEPTDASSAASPDESSDTPSDPESTDGGEASGDDGSSPDTGEEDANPDSSDSSKPKDTEKESKPEDTKKDEKETPKEPDVKEETDNNAKEDKAEESSSAQESLRALMPISISLEADFSTSYSGTGAGDYQWLKTAGRWFIDFMKEAGIFLIQLGIDYGPWIIQKVYRGVLYVMAKTAKILIKAAERLKKYHYRHTNNFQKLEEEIKAVEHLLSVSHTNHPSSSTGFGFSQKQDINNLKINASIDVLKNVRLTSSFVKNTIVELDKSINEELGKITHAANLTSHSDISVPVSEMAIKSVAKFLKNGQLEGYPPPNDHLTAYISNDTVCGDVKVIGFFPSNNLQSLQELKEAYKHSSLFLGVDLSSYKEIDHIPFLNKAQVTSLAQELNILCGICLEHQHFYEKLLKDKDLLKFSIKNYFNSIVSSKEMVPLRETSLELLYHKLMFIDKVYVPAAMDIHEQCIRIIHSGLNLCHKSIDSWQ